MASINSFTGLGLYIGSYLALHHSYGNSMAQDIELCGLYIKKALDGVKLTKEETTAFYRVTGTSLLLLHVILSFLKNRQNKEGISKQLSTLESHIDRLDNLVKKQEEANQMAKNS